MAGNMYVCCVVHPNGEICQHIRQKSFAACSPGLTWQKLCRKDHVIVSTDGVYKVFKDTHAVATVGFLSTHWSVDRTTRRISQTLFSEALICVIAKESCPCYTRVFRALCRAVEVVCGISDLNTRVKQVHMDGHTAIYAAMKQVFVNAVRALDWSHFVAAARRPKMTQLELEAPAFVNIVGTTSCFLFQRQGDLAIGESCVRSLTFFCIVFPPFNPRPGEGWDVPDLSKWYLAVLSEAFEAAGPSGYIAKDGVHISKFAGNDLRLDLEQQLCMVSRARRGAPDPSFEAVLLQRHRAWEVRSRLETGPWQISSCVPHRDAGARILAFAPASCNHGEFASASSWSGFENPGSV